MLCSECFKNETFQYEYGCFKHTELHTHTCMHMYIHVCMLGWVETLFIENLKFLCNFQTIQIFVEMRVIHIYHYYVLEFAYVREYESTSIHSCPCSMCFASLLVYTFWEKNEQTLHNSLNYGIMDMQHIITITLAWHKFGHHFAFFIFTYTFSCFPINSLSFRCIESIFGNYNYSLLTT